MDNRKFLPLIVAGVAGLIFIIALSSSIFLTIRPGETGVLFHKFGNGLEKDIIYGQGFHVIAPWNTMYVYNVKEQTTEEAMDVLDKSGLSISVDVSVRFNPIANKISKIFAVKIFSKGVCQKQKLYSLFELFLIVKMIFISLPLLK